MLRLACYSEAELKATVERKFLIRLLNEIPSYAVIHRRILPLLYKKSKILNLFNELSPESQSLLVTSSKKGIITQLAQHQQINTLTTALSYKNIPIILLKGSAFAESLYSLDSPRTSNDLDILIQKKHWEEASTIISKVMSYSPKMKPDILGDSYEVSYVPKCKTGVALDLHSSLTHPELFSVNESELWEHSIQHPKYQNALVRMLSPEHALIHQAIHAYKDMDFCKYNLVDSNEIIEKSKPDITKAIAIADEWGARTPLYILLSNCSDVMNTNFDSEKLMHITPSFLTTKILRILLKSRFAQPTQNEKTVLFRINQIIGQFVFTGSIARPCKLQTLYIKKLVSRIWSKYFG